MELADTIAGAVKACSPFKPFPFSLKGKKPSVSALLALSDWQIGERIEGRDIEDFGMFDWQIAQERMYGICDDFLKWVNLNRGMYRIEELILPCLGDFINGDIHDGGEHTNEFPAPTQAARAGLLLGEVFRILEPHFGAVRAIEVACDNHGRTGPKIPYKRRAQANYNTLVYTIANAKAERLRRFSAVFSDGLKERFKVGDYVFLAEHGNDIRGWQGIGYYGMERTLGREARKRMNTDKTFSYWLMGHWHVPSVLQDQIMINGCLTGTTELDHANGRFAAPTQVAFLVGKHGYFNWTPFRSK